MIVKNVDFLLTFRCPSLCVHCSYKAGPQRRGYIRASEAGKYLGELHGVHPLESLGVHGGEPLLHFSELKAIMEKGKELAIPKIPGEGRGV